MRDWDEDPFVQAQGSLNRELHERSDPQTRRCSAGIREGTRERCSTAINPMMRLCRYHAEAQSLCQHCLGSLIGSPEDEPTPEEEARETIIDAVTVVVKTFGLSVAVDLLGACLEELPSCALEMHERARRAVEDENLRMAFHGHLDRRDKRPIWTAGLGYNSRRARFCEWCPPARKRPPAFTRATCGHWTAGSEMAACIVCAAICKACERCGVNIALAEAA